MGLPKLVESPVFIGRDGEIWTHDLSHPNQPEGESRLIKIDQNQSKSAVHVKVTSYEKECVGKSATILQPTY